MTSQMTELVLRDADTSKDLKSVRAFKFSKEVKQRLSEEAKKFKDLESALQSLEFQAIKPTIVDLRALPQDALQAFFGFLSIPLEGVVFDKEKIRLVEEGWTGWTTLLGVAVPALGPPSPPELDAFERERQAFLRIRDSLLGNPEFRGKFVAIYRGGIVGRDEDNRELAKRVYREHGYVPIYIGKIERERRVIEMPSPEGV